MARINLLPWRVERRKARQKEFAVMLGLAALGGVLASFLIVTYYNGRISNQNARNEFVRAEITKVDAQIKEIEELDRKKAKLLARKEVIEVLQANRSQMVHLFDELVRTIPDGVALTTIKQEGDILTLGGRSQSNARVSTYMRNLEGSGWMTNPDLNVIEAKAGNPGLPYEFNLKVKLANPNAPKDSDGDGTPDAVQPAVTAPAVAPAAGRYRIVSKKKLNLRELDINNIGAWPQNAKIGLCVIIASVIIGLSWYLFVRDKRTELEGLQRQESELRAEFETKQGRASNLEPLKQQLAQMEQQLQQMLRQLPSKTEMPDLIVDISQTALATGIQNELFQPGPETPKEFYAEKPIALRMVGTYHQFGAFVSGVASLPRVVIMTMHDISLQPKNAKTDPTARIGPNTPLELAGTVKTYRYLDEDETAAQDAAAAAAQPAAAQEVAEMRADLAYPKTLRLASVALIALALAGCGGGNRDLEKWVAEVKARPAPPLDPLPVMQQFETFEYAAQNLRDPFSEAFTGGETGGLRPDPGRRKQTLEQFPLDSLDMVGTLGRGGGQIALVMAPDKVTYRVRPGVYLGQSDGRVTAVYEDRVELVELVPDGAGGWLERPATIALEDN